ncbi:hypothetical protein EVAR_57082_1 [Eumeta japonica]|uniref:Uncharacterized protein n=1 Tax=Eumeta variegata TaxID=151549 RepID=A0A4C1Z8N5_EUMVA|nr:hypothetical protein EVAR_57082_1 [Eumeta japonica]
MYLQIDEVQPLRLRITCLYGRNSARLPERVASAPPADRPRLKGFVHVPRRPNLIPSKAFLFCIHCSYCIRIP